MTPGDCKLRKIMKKFQQSARFVLYDASATRTLRKRANSNSAAMVWSLCSNSYVAAEPCVTHFPPLGSYQTPFCQRYRRQRLHRRCCLR